MSDAPLPHRRRVARQGADRHPRGHARRAAADRRLHRRRPAPAPGRLRPLARASRSRTTARRSSAASATAAPWAAPIAMLIANRVWEDWQEVMQVGPYEGDPKKVTRLRPGHADLAGTMKYGFDDVRNILERASARETAARVAVGAVCRRFLEEFGVAVHSHTDVHRRRPRRRRRRAGLGRRRGVAGALRRRRSRPSAWCAAIDAAKEAGDTLGGIFEMWATGVPIGLGSHVQWDRKLDGQLAQAVMSIHAVKGVEIGGGFAVAGGPGSQAHDVILPPEQWDGRPWRRETNRAGGLEGGMTNGEPVVVRGALKPISTLSKPLPSVDLHHRRADPGPLRALRRLHRPRRRRRRRGDGRDRPGARHAGEVRRRLPRRDAAATSRRTRRRSARAARLMGRKLVVSWSENDESTRRSLARENASRRSRRSIWDTPHLRPDLVGSQSARR